MQELHTPDPRNATQPAKCAASQQAEDHDRQLSLADDLLLKVAKIDRTACQELLKAVDASRDGFANGRSRLFSYPRRS